MLKHSSNVYDAGWLDIVFSQRNKAYGAYALRKSSDAILTKALFIATVGFTMLFVGPFLYDRLNPTIYQKPVDLSAVIDITPSPLKQIPKPLEPAKASLPVTEKAKMKKFTANSRVTNDPVTDEIPKLSELENAVIGPVNQEGIETKGNPVPETPVMNGTGTGEEKTEDNQVYNMGVLEVYPEFNGGMKAWIKFMERNLMYPAIAQDEGIQGTVHVSFVVEKDGSITDITILRGLGGGLTEEAMRVIKKSPKWKPGKQGNNPVRVRYNMPINFRLR